MENLFSIGEVSKYQNISKQTLIFYDKIGLFRPAYVDPQNGYRYYSASQLDDLDAILIMKKLGFPLSRIREHMQTYNIESSLETLNSKLSVIDEQIKELQLIRSRVQQRCEQMEAAKVLLGYDGAIRVEQVERQYILCQPVEPPYSLREISIATKKCFVDSFQQGLPVYFQCGVIVPMERIRAGRCTEASTAFLPIEETCGVENIACLPAGRCVAVCHVGDYSSIGRSYEKLLNYCGAHGLKILSDSYEFCINDYITSRDEAEYVTKIMVYVAE